MSNDYAESSTDSQPGDGLDRQLTMFGTLAVSVAIVAPTLAMSATPSGVAGLVGSAVVVPFLFAFVIIGLVAWGFARLTSRYASAGSVYAFTGLTLGPRTGFFSGWALLGCYTGGIAASCAVAASFGQNVIQQFSDSTNISWIILAALAAIGAGLLALRPLKVVAQTLLIIELLAVALMVIVMVIVTVRVLAGYRPYGAVSIHAVLVPGHGLGLSTIALASIFGFAAFLGFEGAGSVGEEARNPRKTIPKAIVLVVAASGVLFLVCAIVQSVGFGTSAGGVKAFAASSSAFAELARTYSGKPMAIAIGIGATASGFSAALAQVAASSRLVYATSRDGQTLPVLSRVHRHSGEPVNAIILTSAVALALMVGLSVAGVSGKKAFLYIGSFQVLVVLVAYAMTNIGAGVLLFIKEHMLRRWEMLIPILAVVCLGYTLYKQIIPAPPAPLNRIPWIALAWLILGALIAVANPAFASRIGVGLTRSQRPQARGGEVTRAGAGATDQEPASRPTHA